MKQHITNTLTLWFFLCFNDDYMYKYNELSQKNRFQSVPIAAFCLYNIQRENLVFKNSLCIRIRFSWINIYQVLSCNLFLIKLKVYIRVEYLSYKEMYKTSNAIKDLNVFHQCVLDKDFQEFWNKREKCGWTSVIYQRIFM